MPENANRINKSLGIDGIFHIVGAKRLVCLDVSVDQDHTDGDAHLGRLCDRRRCCMCIATDADTAIGGEWRCVRRFKAKAYDQREQNQRAESSENISMK